MRLLAAILCLMLTTRSFANIIIYDCFKSRYFAQTDASAPTAPYSYQFAARVFVDNSGDLGEVTLNFDGPASPLGLESFPLVASVYGPPYPSDEALESNFPSGLYTFDIAGGDIDGAIFSVLVPEPLYTDTIPYFSGDTFDRLQSFDTTQTFEGTIPAFITPSGANYSRTFVAVYDEFGNVVWDDNFEASVGSFTIPAGTIDPGGEGYIISVFFSSRSEGPGTLEGSLAIAGFDLVTQAPLMVIPISPACNLADITEVGGTAEEPGNPDGQLTFDDILVFINLFSESTGCPGTAPCSVADVCGIGGSSELPDGQLTLDDILAFVNAFGEGC